MAGVRWIDEEQPPQDRREAALPPNGGMDGTAIPRDRIPQVTSAPAAAPSGRDTGFLSKVDAAVRGAADVATFGLMDEIAARLGAWTGIGGESGNYEGNLRQQRSVDDFDTTFNPLPRLGGQIAGGVATALVAPSVAARYAGSTALPRIAAGAAEGGAYGGLYGFGSGEGGFEKRLNSGLRDVPLSAALGGAGGFAAPYVARGVDRLMGRGGAADQAAEARTAIAKMLNVPPDQIPEQMVAQWTNRAVDAATGADPGAARAIQSSEFGIPLTRGQATADVGAQAFEEAARNEARGAVAGNTMRNFDAEQRGAVGRAVDDFAARAAGTPEVPSERNPFALSARVLDDLRAAERGAKAGVDQAYDAARAAGSVVQREAVESAPSTVRRFLDDSGIIVNDQLTPYTAKALQDIDQFGQMKGILSNRTATLPGGAGDDIVGVSLDGVEKQRSMLLRAQRNAQASPTGANDARALGQMIRGFDTWMDDIGERGLLAGTDEGLQLYKQARAARRDYGSKFESARMQVDDDAGKLIERMIDKDVQPGEVANALFGASRVGEKGVSTRLAKRMGDIFGKDSEAFGSIKQAAWEKAVRNDKGELLGPQAMASAIQRFAGSGGEAFARTLYSPAEVSRMLRFAKALENTVTDPRARNNSGTAYAVARLAKDSFGSGMGRFLAGLNIPGYVSETAQSAAGLATSLGKNANKARAAARGVTNTNAARPIERATTGATRGIIADQADNREPLEIIVRKRPGAQ